MNKTLRIIGFVTEAFAVGMFVSSFFVKDNNKAVKRRWTSLGVGAVGYGLTVTGKLMKPTTK